MNTIILSLGGSIVSPKDESAINTVLEGYVQLLGKLSASYRVGVIVGGGNRARVGILAAQQASPAISNDDLDWVGIQASQANAKQLASLITGSTFIDTPDTVLPNQTGVFIGGGWKPGRSTDYCAVWLATKNNVKEVSNISNIEYLYDKDPKAFPDAKPLVDVTWGALIALVGTEWKPGLNAPFDPIAAKLASEQGLTVRILNGANLANVELAVTGSAFTGTTVHP